MTYLENGFSSSLAAMLVRVVGSRQHYTSGDDVVFQSKMAAGINLNFSYDAMSCERIDRLSSDLDWCWCGCSHRSGSINLEGHCTTP